jgi:dolichol-phosphate mannosyltransferase
MMFGGKLEFLSVVLPAYQEEENLRLLLPRVKKELKDMKIPHEVIVIDAHKPLDDTMRICQQYEVRCLSREIGNSYGDAVRTGIEEARGEVIIFMDADGSHSPEWISKLYNERRKADVIIASRYVEFGHTENSKVLIAMSRLLNLSYSVLLGIKCNDVSNSYRLYRSDQLKKLTLNCNNFDIVEEILLKLCRNFKPLVILEIPFTFKQRLFGKSKRNLLLFIFTYIHTLIRLRFSK